MASFRSFSPRCLSCFLVFSLVVFRPSIATTPKPTELVDKVCKQTSNYTFCVQTLYTDHRTPDADRYVLAFISFRIAYNSASNTQGLISDLLKKARSHGHDYQRLQRCKGDYNKAVDAIMEAYNDLDSETFFQLSKLAGDAGHAADDCQAAFKGTQCPLGSRNHNLKLICEICAAVGKLYE